jgi:hypothetical protein
VEAVEAEAAVEAELVEAEEEAPVEEVEEALAKGAEVAVVAAAAR